MLFHFSNSSNHFLFLNKSQKFSKTYKNVCYLHLSIILILLLSHCFQIYSNLPLLPLGDIKPILTLVQYVAISSAQNYLLSLIYFECYIVLFRGMFKYLINIEVVLSLRSFYISWLDYFFPCADFFLQNFSLLVMWLQQFQVDVTLALCPIGRENRHLGSDFLLH